MPDKKHGNPKDKRPIVVDDFIYNDPDESVSSAASSSETPDEALRALQDSRKPVSSASAVDPRTDHLDHRYRHRRGRAAAGHHYGKNQENRCCLIF